MHPYTQKCSSVHYQFTGSTVDTNLFSSEIEEAIALRWLRPGEVLVLDNTAIHKGKGNTVFEEWLWESILCLFYSSLLDLLSGIHSS